MNLRQYRQSEVVQAAKIVSSDKARESVVASDVLGNSITIVCPGLFAKGRPPVEGMLLLHPDGSATILSEEEFEKLWSPVGGPVLS